jgi:hypothetical protein
MVSEGGASREDGEATPQTFIEGMNSRARGGLEPEYEMVGFHDMLYAKDMQILFFQPGHVVFTVPVAARLTVSNCSRLSRSCCFEVWFLLPFRVLSSLCSVMLNSAQFLVPILFCHNSNNVDWEMAEQPRNWCAQI